LPGTGGGTFLSSGLQGPVRYSAHPPAATRYRVCRTADPVTLISQDLAAVVFTPPASGPLPVRDLVRRADVPPGNGVRPRRRGGLLVRWADDGPGHARTGTPGPAQGPLCSHRRGPRGQLVRL